MDLDGTLLDSMWVWDSIVERYLISVGLVPSEKLSEAVSSMSMRQACEKIRADYKIEKTADELMKDIIAVADDYYRYHIELKPGADEFLKQLSENGIKICVATANDRSLVEATLARCGVQNFFCGLFSCNELNVSKETPDIYFAAARHMGLGAGEVMVFEDSLHALKTAKAAGFHTAAVYDAHEKAQEEMKNTADLYFEGKGDGSLFSFSRFSDYVKGQNGQ